jgi:3',5'-cyclic AMP phosphodiesterase CpdA
VPGNHDVPLYNVVARFLAPLERYRRLLSPDVEPAFVDDEMVVVGANTARSLTFKRGRINRGQVERAIELFCGTPGNRVRILVTHHPFDLPGTRDGHELVGRAAMAMSGLRECAPDLLLAGHLHRHGIGTTAERYDFGGHSAIVVQAGTATSTRGRGARNSFNLIHVARSDVAIDRFDWSPGKEAFELDSTCRFLRRDGAWTPAGVADA